MQHDPIKSRWVDEPANTGSPESNAGELMRRTGSPSVLTPASLEKIRSGIEEGISKAIPSAKATPAGRPSLKIVGGGVAAIGVGVGVALLFSGGPKAKAPSPVPAAQISSSATLIPADEGALSSVSARAIGLQASNAAAPAMGTPPPAVDSRSIARVIPTRAAQPPERRPRSAPAVVPEVPPTPASPIAQTPAEPAPPEDPLDVESRIISKAISQLHTDHHAADALATLDDYASRFPQGQLSGEAAVARIDALLSLGRRADALGELDRLNQAHYENLLRGAEMRVLRGELLAEGHRCLEALDMFDVGPSVPPPVQERALYGRAACRAALGDERSNEDLRRYLDLYPNGRFADSARKALGR
jgi:hypothetical protein